MQFLPLSTRRLILVSSLALISSLATSIPTRADSISYQINFSTSGGPTVSNGSFQFNALSAVSTQITDANFVNLQVTIGNILYTATSPSDDIAQVDSNGVVTGLFADLEPAANPSGNVLQLFIAGDQYTLFDPTITDGLGTGSYTLGVGVPEPSTLLLLSVGLIGMIGAAKGKLFSS